MNFDSKAISATGLAAAAAASIALATCAPAVADPNLIGSGCSGYAAAHPSGPASVAGMQQDRVADAASHNPMLTTLTKAVSGQVNPDVNLVDTLNSGDYTVFAPTDAAFAKLPASTMDQLKKDPAMLKKILTYHVVDGQLSPAQVDGSHGSLEGGAVNVTGSGDGLRVNDAGLVCGGVPTANATVYMIDTVLTPPA